MKYKLLALYLLAVILAVMAMGCASLLGQPRLNGYSYTRVSIYQGQPVKTIPIWIDKEFGEADKLAIDDAIQAWNYAMNGYIKLRVVDTAFDMEVPKIVQQVREGGWLFLKIKSDNPLVPTTKDKFWTVGFCEQIGGHHLYLVRDRLGNDDIFGVTLHEIGHLMGSGHVGERLMYPHYSRARFQCIDKATIDVVAGYNGIPADRLNFCVDKDAATIEAEKKDAGPVVTNSCPHALD